MNPPSNTPPPIPPKSEIGVIVFMLIWFIILVICIVANTAIPFVYLLPGYILLTYSLVIALDEKFPLSKAFLALLGGFAIYFAIIFSGCIVLFRTN